MVAAIGLGACAVIVGTRFLASTESRASAEYKQAVVAAGPGDIVCTDRVTGNPATWLAESIRDFDRMPDLRSRKWREFWSAGLSVAQTEEIKPAGEIIRQMVTEYETVCRELGQSVRGL